MFNMMAIIIKMESMTLLKIQFVFHLALTLFEKV